MTDPALPTATPVATAPPPPRNGFAVAALVLGIVSFVINPVLLVSIVAIVLGIVALVRSRTFGRRTMSIVAIVLAVLGGIVSLTITAALLSGLSAANRALNDAPSVGTQDSAAPETSDEAEPSASADVPQGYRLVKEGVYAKFGKASSDTFVHTQVVDAIAPDGCSSSLYLEVSLLDKDGTNVGYTNATTGSLDPGQKAVLKMTYTEDDVKTVKFTDASCY